MREEHFVISNLGRKDVWYCLEDDTFLLCGLYCDGVYLCFQCLVGCVGFRDTEAIHAAYERSIGGLVVSLKI